MRMPLLILLLILLISGCTTSDPSHVPTNWVQIDTHRFTFCLPPNIKQIPYQGIDSFVGAYESDSVHLRFDYGLYSNALDKWELEASGCTDYTSHETIIHGEKAHIASYYFRHPNPFNYEIAVHFPYTNGHAKLTFFASCKSKAEFATATKIFETIKFKEPKAK